MTRIVKTVLGAASLILAFLTSILTLLVAVSRVVNDPPGVESGLWVYVSVAAVGMVGAVLLFFRLYAAAIALGLAAVLTVTVIIPENGLPAALYAGSAVLALAAYSAGGGMTQAVNSRRRTGA